MINRPLHIKGMHGLGDNIMQRPFIKAAAVSHQVYLETPWPELYQDIENVFPVKPGSNLRTQAKNEARTQIQWHHPRGRRIRMHYGPHDLARTNIWKALARRIPLAGHSFKLDLPELPAPRIDTGGKPLAVIRPVTARSEWLNTARNPLPEYVNRLAEMLALTHYVVAIADIEDGAEWLVGDMPFCDLAFIRGELSAMEALGLVVSADVVVGGVGWILPARLAAHKPAFIVLGGMGAHNAPDRLTDPQWVPGDGIGWATPSRYCLCDQKDHQCDKRIPDLEGQFMEWCVEQQVPLCSEMQQSFTATSVMI